METKHDQEFREALAISREIFEKRVSCIDEEIERLKVQRRLAEQDYKSQKDALQQLFNSPTEHSIA